MNALFFEIIQKSMENLLPVGIFVFILLAGYLLSDMSLPGFPDGRGRPIPARGM